MVFNIGEAISLDLSDYLKEYTTQKDRIDVAKKFNYGFFTLDSIVSQKRNVTEDNYPMVVELTRVAIANRNRKYEQHKKIHKRITEVLTA